MYLAKKEKKEKAINMRSKMPRISAPNNEMINEAS